MVVMFVVGVFLALGFGVTSGILYAQHQRSIFTKKFTENLKKVTKEYEEQMLKIQENDKKVLGTIQQTLKGSFAASLNTMQPDPFYRDIDNELDEDEDDDDDDLPPGRGRYN